MKTIVVEFFSAACVFATLFALPVAHADVKLEPAQRKNLGIEVAPLKTAKVSQTYAASAQVLDATPLITLLSDLRAAQSAAQASRSEFERAQRLHADDNNVALKVVEAAHVQSVNDAGHVDALRAQLLSAWGTTLASMPDKDRTQLVDALLGGKAVLARAETRGGATPDEGFNFHRAQVRLLTSSKRWDADVIGPATQSVGQGNAASAVVGIGHAYLLRVNSATLQPGQVLSVDLADSRQAIEGIKVPRSAIVRWQGSDWVFIETEDNTFARHSIHPVQWLSDGCLVQKELQADDHVVTVGSALLLAAESAPAAAAD